MISRRILLALPLAALLTMFSTFSVANCALCPFCSADKGPTLAGDFDQAMAVVLVHVDQEPQQNANGETYTEVVIDQVIKPHAVLKGKQKLILRRKIDKTDSQILLFCDVFKDKIDAYRGVDVPKKSDVIKYFQGAVALKDKSVSDRLRYCFDYLNSSDLDVSTDAYREFAIADYKDYKTLAKSLPADKIAGWLKDSRTPPFRYGLYSSLLGHCGTAEHAKLLRTMIGDAIKNKSSDIDGLLAGYVMLQPKEAWAYVQSLLRDGKEDFLVRFSCVRVAGFLRDQRPDLVPAKDLTSAVATVLDYPDMADIGIDFLRKAKAWDRTDQILNLCGKKSPGKDYDNDFIKRAILRFALLSPEPRAAAFVKEMRGRNAEFVNNTEELLKLESQ